MVVEGAACHAGLFGYLGNRNFSRILFAAEKIESRQEIFLGLGISDIFARVVHGDYSFSLLYVNRTGRNILQHRDIVVNEFDKTRRIF